MLLLTCYKYMSAVVVDMLYMSAVVVDMLYMSAEMRITVRKCIHDQIKLFLTLLSCIITHLFVCFIA